MTIDEKEQALLEKIQDEELLEDFDELYDVNLEDMPGWFFRLWVENHYPKKEFN